MKKIIKYLIIILCILIFIIIFVRYFNTVYKKGSNENIINREDDFTIYETDKNNENKKVLQDTENEETLGDEVAYVRVMPTSVDESFEIYTYRIFKKSEEKYYYKRIEKYGWLNEVTSERITDKGNIENKEQLNIIKEEIDKYNDNFYIDGYSNFEIYFKNERLKSIEELAERLF